jgi:putative DNA primase/helicase
MNAEHAQDRQGRVLPPPSDPMAVARELVAAAYLREEQLLLRRWRGGWWTWETTHWRERDEPEVRKVAYAFTELATYYNTAKKTPALEPWEPNRYKIADLLDALAALCHLREDLQPPEWIVPAKVLPADALVSCANGLLHVGTRTLHVGGGNQRWEIAVFYEAARRRGWFVWLCDCADQHVTLLVASGDR